MKVRILKNMMKNHWNMFGSIFILLVGSYVVPYKVVNIWSQLILNVTCVLTLSIEAWEYSEGEINNDR